MHEKAAKFGRRVLGKIAILAQKQRSAIPLLGKPAAQQWVNALYASLIRFAYRNLLMLQNKMSVFSNMHEKAAKFGRRF